MPTKQKSSGNESYQIKVTLLRTVPPVWRRLLVPSDITRSGLHDLLQLAMGWTDATCTSSDSAGNAMARPIRSEVRWRGSTSATYGSINYGPALVQRSFTRKASAAVGSMA